MGFTLEDAKLDFGASDHISFQKRKDRAETNGRLGRVTDETTWPDLRFDWDATEVDGTGIFELLSGYLVERATEPTFGTPGALIGTTGADTTTSAPGEGGEEPGLVFYRVRARDKCGNVGP